MRNARRELRAPEAGLAHELTLEAACLHDELTGDDPLLRGRVARAGAVVRRAQTQEVWRPLRPGVYRRGPGLVVVVSAPEALTVLTLEAECSGLGQSDQEASLSIFVHGLLLAKGGMLSFACARIVEDLLKRGKR